MVARELRVHLADELMVLLRTRARVSDAPAFVLRLRQVGRDGARRGLISDGEMRLSTNPPVIATGLGLHAAELKMLKSPFSIRSVGTNASKSEGVLRNFVPW